MAKEVLYDDKAREKVLAGAKTLYDGVKVTMGPKGRNVVIRKGNFAPVVTHDGVTVARGIEVEDVAESVGADLIRQAASRSNDTVGDGTTTTTVLTYHILKSANKLIAADHNPMDLKKQLDIAAEAVLKELTKLTNPIADDQDQIINVATISASGDEEIGSLIADVISTVGVDGSVNVQVGQTMTIEKEIVEGYKIQRGYISPYMVTNDRMEASYDQPLILLTDRRIDSVGELMPLLKMIKEEAKRQELVIIAEDFSHEVLGTLMLNKIKGVFNTLCIKAPAAGGSQQDILEDIAILTGGTVASQSNGLVFADMGVEHFGTARRVVSTKDTTTIIEGAGDKEELSSRVDAIKYDASQATSEAQQEGFEKRVADLLGKVAIIKVGGATETEIEEKKFRVDDAVAATRAAVAEGIVDGGGITLIDLAHNLDDDSLGARILKEALKQPFLQLMENAGLDSASMYAQLTTLDQGEGFNVMTGHIVNLKDAGIIDPSKVTREAIQNAVSVAGTAITMGALVIDVDEPKND